MKGQCPLGPGFYLLLLLHLDEACTPAPHYIPGQNIWLSTPQSGVQEVGSTVCLPVSPSPRSSTELRSSSVSLESRRSILTNPPTWLNRLPVYTVRHLHMISSTWQGPSGPGRLGQIQSRSKHLGSCSEHSRPIPHQRFPPQPLFLCQTVYYASLSCLVFCSNCLTLPA